MYFKIFSVNNQYNAFIKRINNYCTTGKNFYQTHYEVLKLQSDCSPQEIKDAFIKLSKEYHPDSTSTKASNKDFIKILEAYNVLSKPNLRRNYDLGISNPANYTRNTSHEHDYNPVKGDSSFYEFRDKSQDIYYKAQPYYGIKGIRKVPNLVIVLLCLVFTVIGVSLQIFAIKKSVTLKRDVLLKQSQEASETLDIIKREAIINGNRIQLQLLKDRMEKQNLIQKKGILPKD